MEEIKIESMTVKQGFEKTAFNQSVCDNLHFTV